MIDPGDDRRLDRSFLIWEGIFKTFQQAEHSAVGPGFNGDLYCSRSMQNARECLLAAEAGVPISPVHMWRFAPLPTVAALMLRTRSSLRILDFGGGLGMGYLALAQSIPDVALRISYTIVELAGIASEGRSLFRGAIEYQSELPSNESFDLVYCASAMQYVEDWQGLLRAFSRCEPEFILLSDVFAGAIPTFVTLQSYYDNRMCHWFLNLDELNRAIAQVGYQSIMKDFVNSWRLGSAASLPMDNFPETHRLKESLHLLLSRCP